MLTEPKEGSDNAVRSREKNEESSKQKTLGNMYLLIVALERNALLNPILQKYYKHHEYQWGKYPEKLEI